MSFIQKALKAINNEFACIASEGTYVDDMVFLDSGCYVFNAQLSGSIYGGVPGKVTGLAGQSATGKTFLMVSILDHFLRSNPKSEAVLFETEGAISKKMLEARGVDTSRVLYVPVSSIQAFRTQCSAVITQYEEGKEKPPALFLLDSLGMLENEKNIEDASKGEVKADTGALAKLIKGTFRILTLRLAKNHIPMLVTNHVYDVPGAYVPTKKHAGGSGLEYAASTIIELNKKKEKDEESHEVTGVILSSVMRKGRESKQDTKVDMLLRFDTGLSRYYGLLELGEELGIVKRVSSMYELPGGIKAYRKTILEEPEKYFTKELLDAIDAQCWSKFMYGTKPVK